VATIDNQEIIASIIANDGWYQGDKSEMKSEMRVVKVVSYLNQWGNYSTAVVYEKDDYMRYEMSPACFDVKVLWEAK